ncbi:helix-turn-helix domain-containing protein [Saccharomonospora iraqiensis]|uniref:helix-turn-helix domain-containing protein n=1 Tax=Saccharomonospora iraqiensis TaxID=52698 RepID=UPI00047C6E5A|nr:helix-turn-helix domain-containing protein [Saccharomonospora iraqiensis]
MGTELRQETYVPETAEQRQLASVQAFLETHGHTGAADGRSAYLLSGAGRDEQVELPEEVSRVLRHVVEALRHGLAVTVAPQNTTLTTQQAAELLGVSRPTVVRLLDDGEIPFDRVGTHRRIALRDLLSYRDRRRAEQYAALEATAVDEDEDIDTTLARLRSARKEVARRRRHHTGGM